MNKIGVVVCNFNGEKYIIGCLDAVFNSDIEGFDVYVVDNASTDNSVNLVIEKYGDKVNIIAACYPEGHIEAHNIVDDVKHLKEKVDAGASQLITQLFFNNDSFYRFKERCDLVDIKVPILAGIVPVANKKQIERIVTLCGVELPAKFTKIMSKYEDNPEALRDAGIAYAIDQIVDLITQGIDGIHLYTMNNPYIATRLHEAIKNLI